MSFDNETVGKMQADALVKAMGDKGNILMLNGAPSDPNAAQFKAGAHSVLDSSGVKILEEYDNPDWSAENAQKFVTDQLSKYDAIEIQGVYAANDGQAGGVVAALTGAGVARTRCRRSPVRTPSSPAIQRIVAGEQAMTIYKPIPIEAEHRRRGRRQAGQRRGRRHHQRHRHRPDRLQGRHVLHLHPDRRHRGQRRRHRRRRTGSTRVEDICTAEYADALQGGWPSAR